MSSRSSAGNARPARKAHKLTDICEPIFWEMCDRPLGPIPGIASLVLFFYILYIPSYGYRIEWKHVPTEHVYLQHANLHTSLTLMSYYCRYKSIATKLMALQRQTLLFVTVVC
jgi:hypothetical protein